MICCAENESGTRRGIWDRSFEIQYIGVPSRTILHVSFLDMILLATLKRSVSEEICGPEHESSTGKDVSGQMFEFEYVSGGSVSTILFLLYTYAIAGYPLHPVYLQEFKYLLAVGILCVVFC